jgi:hypothetical protein
MSPGVLNPATLHSGLETVKPPRDAVKMDVPQQWGHHIGRKASSASQRVRTGDYEPVDVMVNAQATLAVDID